MATKKYRVAVVGGAGTWGRYYLRAYANHPDCEIVALVDRARARRQAFADRYGVQVVYDTLDDLLTKEVPDIVSVILPVGHNPGAVIACAEAGVKAVSCEKPIAAELSQADAMVRICRERGTAFGCGTGYWDAPHLPETADWIRAGNIGRPTGAAIPGGLPVEVSGGGCVQLTMMRLLTGMEVEWVEGWALPPEAGWMPPVDMPEVETDSPAYGRLGLSGGIVCDIPEPRPDQRVFCPVAIQGENGRVWISSPKPILIEGRGAASTPVYPEFLDAPRKDGFTSAIERLMRAVDAGEEALCSGHDYRQALEIAIALKQSAQRGHQRISLPLEDRSLKLYPHPYRLKGGDVAGWESIGYTGPPEVA
ncbi:MAG: Gfo/Idh/MocA family oxidoreductase [Candidatus Poribacteria bacterium]|nr:Gfo/Idh/MocA family oxidoreductase [Candidatus Poribacteria bacterium]